MQARVGELVSPLVTAEQTGGRYALLEMVLRRGEESPLHTHTREDELVYVLQGEVTFYLGGKQLEREAGECVLLQRGCEHTYCIESEEARLLVLLMPAGLEGYYQELDRHTGDEQYIERLVTVAARYGVEITGPPPQEGPLGGRDPTYHTGDDASCRQQ